MNTGKTKRAPRQTSKGSDRWTSNGYGSKMGPQTEAQRKQIAQLNAELASSAQKKKKK